METNAETIERRSKLNTTKINIGKIHSLQGKDYIA